jgi:hypothetical protein
VLRTTGFNSIRTLAARLRYYQAASNDLLSCLPLALKLRGKSTTQSYRAPIYYVDLTIREGLTLPEAIVEAQRLDQQRRESGFCQQALDDAAHAGFGNAIFEVDEDEALTVLEEFYPAEGQPQSAAAQNSTASTPPRSGRQPVTPLRDKLAQRSLNQ